MKLGTETNLENPRIGIKRDIPIINKMLITETNVMIFSLKLSPSFLEAIIHEIIPIEILNVGNKESRVLIVEIG